MCYLRRKYNQARDRFLRSRVLPAELFIIQHSLTKNVLKINLKKEIGRQFIFNRVPVKLNERKKQIKQNRFPKTNWGKNLVSTSCNKWNKLNVKLRKVKTKLKFIFDLKRISIEIQKKILLNDPLVLFEIIFITNISVVLFFFFVSKSCVCIFICRCSGSNLFHYDNSILEQHLCLTKRLF